MEARPLLQTDTRSVGQGVQRNMFRKANAQAETLPAARRLPPSGCVHSGSWGTLGTVLLRHPDTLLVHAFIKLPACRLTDYSRQASRSMSSPEHWGTRR